MLTNASCLKAKNCDDNAALEIGVCVQRDSSSFKFYWSCNWCEHVDMRPSPIYKMANSNVPSTFETSELQVSL